MKDNALVIMAKSPEADDIKTRLSPRLNRAERVALYIKLLASTIKRLRDIKGVDTFISHTPDDAARYFHHFGLSSFPQGLGDIGQRMHRALSHVLDMGYARAAIVGSDIPALTPRVVRSAFEALPQADLAIGPAMDGGYYLIGMSRPIPELFQGIPWSSRETLKETVGKARAMGLSMEILDILDDVDTPEDLEKLGLI